MKRLLLVAAMAMTLSGCGNRVVSGSDIEPAAPSPSLAPVVSAGPSAEVVKTWPTKWCRARIGATRDEMRDLMGEPTDESTADETPAGFQPSMTWDAFEYQFNAFFGVDDTVRQLDVNDIELSAAEKAAISCDFTRTAN